MSRKFLDRPASYYDNYGGASNSDDDIVDDYNDDLDDLDGDAGTGRNRAAYDGYASDDKYDRLRNEMLGYERAKSPTQTISLLTTVPQNITPTNIAGRHAPTRHSLRHSRMIVMNRLAVPRKSMPPLLRFHKLAKILVGLQCFLGLATGFMAFWIFIWTPSLKQRDNPYWSAIPLTVSGLIGVILLFCYRKEYPGSTRKNLIYSFKVLSIFLSVVAGLACLISASFSVIHLIGLSLMDCEPALKLNNTCLCTLSNDTTILPFMPKTYHYVDLQCHELNDFFVMLLICACGTNLLGSLTALWYVYLHWSSRYLYTYSKVHTNELSPTVIMNDDDS